MSAATWRSRGRRVIFGTGSGGPYLYGVPLLRQQKRQTYSVIWSAAFLSTPTHGPWYHRSHASQPIMNLDVVAASLPVQKQQACGGQHSQSSHQGGGRAASRAEAHSGRRVRTRVTNANDCGGRQAADS